MEKDNEFTLLKSRSSQACIRDGYKFYAAGFRQIFRYTWPLAIVFAILSAAASALPVLVSPSLLLAGAALALISVVLWLWYPSCCYSIRPRGGYTSASCCRKRKSSHVYGCVIWEWYC